MIPLEVSNFSTPIVTTNFTPGPFVSTLESKNYKPMIHSGRILAYEAKTYPLPVGDFILSKRYVENALNGVEPGTFCYSSVVGFE
jgi:hypothetical protein